MEIPDEVQILGATDEDFYGSQVVGIKRKSAIGTRYGYQAVAPPGGQGFENGIAQDIGVISVTQVIGPVPAERLIEHDRGDLVLRLRADIGVESGRERGVGQSQFGERRQKGC
jgi:hypothetical protein